MSLAFLKTFDLAVYLHFLKTFMAANFLKNGTLLSIMKVTPSSINCSFVIKSVTEFLFAPSFTNPFYEKTILPGATLSWFFDSARTVTGFVVPLVDAGQ